MKPRFSPIIAPFLFVTSNQSQWQASTAPSVDTIIGEGYSPHDELEGSAKMSSFHIVLLCVVVVITLVMALIFTSKHYKK